MGKNVFQKILDSHIIEGKPVAGTEIGIKIDQTLTQDATGTMAYLQFEAMGFDRVKTELSVSYVDHNTIQDGFENADDHKYLQSVAARYGVVFSKAGNGICHQVHLERFGCPGKTLLGSDSHTPTAGAIAMIGIGAGGLDVAVAMGGGLFYLTYPKVVKIELKERLRPWVSAKDIILKVLDIVSTKGNVGRVFEYGGEGIATLSVPQRATIANMGAETGATTSIFPSDQRTLEFLKAQGREQCFIPLEADKDASYEKVITIDLSQLQPLVACPHSPANIKTVKDLAPMKVEQVIIGSCTNSSYQDLMIAASLLKGKKIASNISFGVAPSSRQVLKMIAKNGALFDIISSGARILESACGFCIGNSMAPGSNGISVRTSNRNFEGRSGTKDAKVYLVSVETAVATALAGELVDPQQYFASTEYPSISLPEKFDVDDAIFEWPPTQPQKIPIIRGPNIGNPPTNEECPDDITAEVIIYLGDKITTDHIMPAGSRLKYRSNIAKYAEFVFERIDPGFSQKALANKEKGIYNIIVAAESYGQGSSREHAAICPMYLGVKMIIARSIERIHRANLINFGIIPLLFENPADYEKLAVADKLRAKNIREQIRNNSTFLIYNETRGTQLSLKIDLSDRERQLILCGGLINATKLLKK